MSQQQTPCTKIKSTDLEFIEYIGRWSHQKSDCAVASWPGSAFRFRIHGEHCTLKMEQQVVVPGHTIRDWIDVVVDGVTHQSFPLKKGVEYYRLGKWDYGDHEIILLKRTESMCGRIVLHELSFEDSNTGLNFRNEQEQFFVSLNADAPGGVTENGSATAVNESDFPAAGKTSPLRIEFIGDSLLCGYGMYGPPGMGEFNSDHENARHAYGALAAERVGAAYTLISYSGKGLVMNFDGTDHGGTMKTLWKRVQPHDPELFDFQGPPPDLVVINLGTNDLYGGPPGMDEYHQAMIELLEDLMDTYNHPAVLLQDGPLIKDEWPAHANGESRKDLTRIRATLDNVCDEANERWGAHTKIYRMSLPTDLNPQGTRMHPEASWHRTGAKVLEAWLRDFQKSPKHKSS